MRTRGKNKKHANATWNIWEDLNTRKTIYGQHYVMRQRDLTYYRKLYRKEDWLQRAVEKSKRLKEDKAILVNKRIMLRSPYDPWVESYQYKYVDLPGIDYRHWAQGDNQEYAKLKRRYDAEIQDRRESKRTRYYLNEDYDQPRYLSDDEDEESKKGFAKKTDVL